MSKVNHNLSLVTKRRMRVRQNIVGTAQRPRLTVDRSNKHIFIQAIDDSARVTLASVGDLSLAKTAKKAVAGTKSDKAKAVAEAMVAQLEKLNITKVAFDRGSYRYHGRVKVIAEVLREKGIQV